MLKMTFVEPGGMFHEVDVDDGSTVLDVARRHGFDLEGACEGCRACSTCHVIVDDNWFKKLDHASEEEEDLLDLAAGRALRPDAAPGGDGGAQLRGRAHAPRSSRRGGSGGWVPGRSAGGDP